MRKVAGIMLRLLKGSQDLPVIDISESVKKTVRMISAILVFLGYWVIVSMGTRQAHQYIFMMAVIVMLGLYLKNIWVTLFLWWSVYLYALFKFTGTIYMVNIMLGCLFFYFIKTSYRTEHIRFYFKVFMWFIVANIGYIVMQLSGLDLIYLQEEWVNNGTQSVISWNTLPIGFMSFTAGMGMLMALAIPVVGTRPGKLSWLTAPLLLIPVWLSQSSLNFIAAIIGLMFVLWFKLKRGVWFIIAALLVAGGAYYTVFIDRPNPERVPQWKESLRDATQHPVIGYGLDSFGKPTETKNFQYAKKAVDEGNYVRLLVWDNPHNLAISLFYEWGILGLLILGGYIRLCVLRFRKSIKDPDMVALAGFLLVVLLLSMGHFPLFLTRIAVIIIPIAAFFDMKTENKGA